MQKVQKKDFYQVHGQIKELNLPGGNGIRIDTAVYSGYTIPASYDSMIAKIIVHGEDREEAIIKMKRALDECVIDGVDTNLSLHDALPIFFKKVIMILLSLRRKI